MLLHTQWCNHKLSLIILQYYILLHSQYFYFWYAFEYLTIEMVKFQHLFLILRGYGIKKSTEIFAYQIVHLCLEVSQSQLHLTLLWLHELCVLLVTLQRRRRRFTFKRDIFDFLLLHYFFLLGCFGTITNILLSKGSEYFFKTDASEISYKDDENQNIVPFENTIPEFQVTTLFFRIFTHFVSPTNVSFKTSVILWTTTVHMFTFLSKNRMSKKRTIKVFR